MSYRIRLLLVLLATAVVTSGLSVTIAYVEFRQILWDEIRSKVLSIAASGAALLDGDHHRQVWNARDESSPEYRALDAAMRKLRDANRRDDLHIKYVYTMRQRPGQSGTLEFGVDPEEDPKEKPHLRDVYRGHFGRKIDVEQPEVDERFTEDRWGHWLTASAPIRDSAGKTVAAFAVDMAASEVLGDMRRALLRSLLGLGGGILLAVGAAVVLSWRVTRPLAKVREAVEAIGKGRLDTRVDIRSRDEFGVVASAVNDMAVGLQERERMSADLKVAHAIQMSLLPRNFDLVGFAGRVDLYATVEPAREVGGDFYDFFPLPGGRVGFVVGDVSGKGVPASLHMAMTKTLIHAASRRGDARPDEVLVVVNEELARDNEAMIFVTIFFGILDPASGELAYTSAGHMPPLLATARGSRWVTEAAIVAGVDAEARFPAQTIRLEPGDVILVYSDGVTEARSVGRELFGEERLAAAAPAFRGRSSRQVVEAVVERVKAFADGAPQADDITVLALRIG